jgi:acid stress-induced BolA-like protein IbaG/YrbA
MVYCKTHSLAACAPHLVGCARVHRQQQVAAAVHKVQQLARIHGASQLCGAVQADARRQDASAGSALFAA